VICVFYILAVLLIAQALLSLIKSARHLAFIRRDCAAPLQKFTPLASIIVPCKGIDLALEENLRALFDQHYPSYEIIFAVATESDAARPVIERVMLEHPHRPARLVVAGRSHGRSEKVNNLLCALDQINSESEVLVFADSDVRVHPDWLGALLAPLASQEVGATTGYRLLLPEKGGFWSAVLSAWNSSVAATLGDHDRNFAWGGSTAMLRKTFNLIGVRARWSNAASDDYALTNAVRDAGLRINFVPRCLIPSYEDVRLRSLLEFTTRQVIITRVYNPRLWWLGMSSYLLFNVTFFGGIALAIYRAICGMGAGLVLVMLSAIYLLGSLSGLLKLKAAMHALSEDASRAVRLWWMFCLLWPVVSMVFLYNFLRSATTRRINWRGVCYELRSATETIVNEEVSQRGLIR
jgi:ceramide glucosyltransferase